GGAGTHTITAPAFPATYVAVFSASDTTSYLSDLAWTQVANGWGPVEKDRSNGENLAGAGAPLTLNGVTYAKGLGTHAASEVDYAMAGACSLFTASVGVDDEISSVEASLVFQVWGDTTKLYDSGTMGAATATKALSVDVAGRTTLRLVVTDGGDGNFHDHGDWANAQLTCGGGAPPPDTTPPTVTTTSPATGATGVAVAANITATFSEAMTASSISTSSVTLVVQGTTPLLAASVNYDPVSLTVTLHPSASLAAATTYLATVKGGASGVKDAAGNALALDKTWTFTTAAAADTTPPTVTTTSPATGATGVAVAANITATFSEAMTASSISTSSVTLVVQGTTPLLAASVNYDPVSLTVTLHPSASLAAATTYLATVKGGASGVKDAAGNALALDKTWTFTTAAAADTTPPTVTTTSPATGATGVAVAANITATFSEAMTASSISTSSVTLVVQGTTPRSEERREGKAGSLTVTLHPSASLAAATTYLATVKGGASGVKDAAGNALALDKTWTFTTAAAADTTPPTVTTTSPATGATGVAVAANITATFSEAMTASSISTSSVTLVVQGTTPLLAASVNYDPVSLTVTLHPSASLAAATTYLATVKGGASGVKDAAGNALALDKTWTFTTAAAADTTPPTVTTTSPATGATGVAVAANITATFSEAMTASSISTSSVTLVVQGTTSLLAASVNYDPVSLTVTLHPSASLAAATTYLATVKGGASGVKDAAGNALALDKTWTFTTRKRGGR